MFYLGNGNYASYQFIFTVNGEEIAIDIKADDFINNHYIPPFQRELASIAVYHDLHTNKDAVIRQPAISRLEKRVDPDGQRRRYS